MNDEYRLIACSVCSVVRLEFVLKKQERERPSTYIRGIPVYRRNFCPPCEQRWDEMIQRKDQGVRETQQKRGADIWSCAACGNLYTSKSQWLDHAAWHAQRDDTINAILDKVIEMDRCPGPMVDGQFYIDPIHSGKCCNGTGLGDIARYVKEARG